MPRPRRQKFVAEQFAKRLHTAMDQNPNCPPKYHGERKWLAERLLKLGVNVGLETIRKWYEGETLPAPDKFPAIAEALQVDLHWLMFGESEQETVGQHSYEASALTNVVAGIIALDGGTISFPVDDARVKGGQVHLNAIVRGANYPLHIVGGTVEGESVSFRVPLHLDGVIVIGVVRQPGGFGFDLYELEQATIAEKGQYERGAIQVSAPVNDLKPIRTFTERL